MVETKFTDSRHRSVSEVVEGLARVLYDELERLAADSEYPPTRWDCLSGWRRDLYVNCIDRLFEERELVKAAYELTYDDMILGGADKCKQP